MTKITRITALWLLLPLLASTAEAQTRFTLLDSDEPASTPGFIRRHGELAENGEFNFEVETESERESERERIETERHDFTQSTTVVGRGTTQVEFGLDYIYGWRLNPRVEIYGSSGFSTNALGEFAFRPTAPADEEFILYTQSVAIGTELSDRVTAYTEFFGLFTDGFENDEERPVFFNVGLDYYVSDNVVLDVRAGTGLNADAEDLFFGMGGAFRF